MIRNALARVAYIYRALFFDAQGTPGLSRHAMLLFGGTALVGMWVMIGLLVYVVAADKMVEAAPLAGAVATGFGAVFSSSVLTTGAMYWMQARYGGGGPTAMQAAGGSREQLAANEVVNEG